MSKEVKLEEKELSYKLPTPSSFIGIFSPYINNYVISSTDKITCNLLALPA